MVDGSNMRSGFDAERMDDLATLGLSADADESAIRSAYRRLAIEHHPDRGGSHVAMSQVNEAFDRLTTTKPRPVSAHTGPPVWMPSRSFDDLADPQDERPFPSGRRRLPAASVAAVPLLIIILVVLPAATVLGLIYVVSKILF